MAKYLLFLAFFGLVIQSRSQNQFSDTSFYSLAKKNAEQLYTKTPGAYAQLYNGRAYSEYRQVAEEHPYLFLDWVEGTICYAGKVFEDVPMMYDLSSDELITEHSSGAKIALQSERVSFIVFKKHRYEFIKAIELRQGFYEILYAGKIKLVARREKTKSERIISGVLNVEFEEHVKYFVMISNQFTHFSNKKSLIKILSGDNTEIKKRLTGERLDFKNHKESSFTELVRIFDQMNSSL